MWLVAVVVDGSHGGFFAVDVAERSAGVLSPAAAHGVHGLSGDDRVEQADPGGDVKLFPPVNLHGEDLGGAELFVELDTGREGEGELTFQDVVDELGFEAELSRSVIVANDECEVIFRVEKDGLLAVGPLDQTFVVKHACGAIGTKGPVLSVDDDVDAGVHDRRSFVGGLLWAESFVAGSLKAAATCVDSEQGRLDRCAFCASIPCLGTFRGSAWGAR